MRFVRVVAVIVAIALAGSPLAVTPAGAQAREYRIGAIMELSGPFSQWGAPMRDAIQLAVDNINAAGGVKGVPLKLVIYDGRSKGTEAALLAKRLAEQDRVVAIIGPGTSPTTMPLIPYVTGSSSRPPSGAGCSACPTAAARTSRSSSSTSRRTASRRSAS
jgi:branched-chain amino acid transport system substrate-binding protein